MTMPAVKKKKPVSSPLREVVDKAMRNRGVVNTEPMHEAIDVFLNGKVCGADIVMFDRTPMVRATIRHNGRYHRADKASPLMSLVGRKEFPIQHTGVTLLGSDFLPTILPLLPQDQVAMQMADIANASAAALQDPKKLAPIQARIKARRMADKERLMSKIREVFRGHDNLISEDEILAMWRETMCAEVMDS